MRDRNWRAVDQYFAGELIPADPALNGLLEASAAAGLPSIQVSAAQGKLLHLLALAQAPKRILEIGTLGGYSTLWLARALPTTGGYSRSRSTVNMRRSPAGTLCEQAFRI